MKISPITPRYSLKFAFVAVALAAVLPARAGLILTQAGLDLGFQLSTFATGTGNYDPLSAAALSDGNLVVVNYAAGTLIKLADVDGQVAFGPGSTALATVGLSGVTNVATVGGHTYAGVYGGGFYEVHSDLSLLALTVPGVTHTWGLWANQATGHLLTAASQGLIDFNPTTGTSTNVWGYGGFDGVSVSPDGRYFYAAGAGNIYRYDTVTGNQIEFADGQGRSPDGSGVISGSTLNGDVISNNNDGTVSLLDATTGAATIIATGGMRGDFASADGNNGTLFLASSDGGSSVMYRLAITGGSIGSNNVPDAAATAGMLGLALAGLLILRRKPARS